MSYANYGPTFRSRSIVNATPAAIAVPAVADGAAIATIPCIQTATNVEIPLVLGEGAWEVDAYVAYNADNGAHTLQYGQAAIFNATSGALLAGSGFMYGADIADGHNIFPILSANKLFVVAPGATLTLAYRFQYTGLSAPGDGLSLGVMTATKLN